jgi:hypothetical protein
MICVLSVDYRPHRGPFSTRETSPGHQVRNIDTKPHRVTASPKELPVSDLIPAVIFPRSRPVMCPDHAAGLFRSGAPVGLVLRVAVPGTRSLA